MSILREHPSSWLQLLALWGGLIGLMFGRAGFQLLRDALRLLDQRPPIRASLRDGCASVRHRFSPGDRSRSDRFPEARPARKALGSVAHAETEGNFPTYLPADDPKFTAGTERDIAQALALVAEHVDPMPEEAKRRTRIRVVDAVRENHR